MALTIDKLPAPAGMPEWQWILGRVQLLLIQGGFKQAITMQYTPNNVPNVISSINDLSRKLSTNGLRCRVAIDSNRGEYGISVGKNDQTLDELKLCLSGKLPIDEADLIHGRLSGFPDSAIEAFIANDVIQPEALPKTVRLSPEYVFATFRFSKEHWREELDTSKKWALYIKDTAPELYEQYLKRFTEQ